MDEEFEELFEGFEGYSDNTQVLEALEVMQQSVDQVNAGLDQLHADASMVFLGVILIVGVILGCAVSFMFTRIWGS